MLEDREEYIAALPEGVAEQQARAPFEPLVIVNPRLRALSDEGARWQEVRAAAASLTLGPVSCCGVNLPSACTPAGLPPGAVLQRSALDLTMTPASPLRAAPPPAWPQGCLSVPGYAALVERYACVEVEGLTPEGEPLVLQALGWQARILQHECDHLKVRRRSAPAELLFSPSPWVSNPFADHSLFSRHSVHFFHAFNCAQGVLYVDRMISRSFSVRGGGGRLPDDVPQPGVCTCCHPIDGPVHVRL